MPEVVDRLLAGEPAAWSGFLEIYSPLILQVARLLERDEDRTADCFLFACEGLRRNGCRRLRAYRPGGAASFSTWLRVVVRNLALDWRRSRFGRRVVPAAVTSLEPLERELYLLLNHRGLTVDEALGALQTLFPRLQTQDFLDALERLHSDAAPPPRPRLVRSTAAGVEARVAESRPGPEELAATRERTERVARALERLPAGERLLVRLRFEADLTLAQVAERAGLGSPQAADRKLRSVLDRLRSSLTSTTETDDGDSV